MIEIADIEHLISPPLFSALSANNGEKYEPIKSAVLELIESETGIDTSDSELREGLEWMILPFAFLVEYTAADLIINASPDFNQRVQAKYKQAIEILSKHKITRIRAGAKAQIGTIEGMYQ